MFAMLGVYQSWFAGAVTTYTVRGVLPVGGVWGTFSRTRYAHKMRYRHPIPLTRDNNQATPLVADEPPGSNAAGPSGMMRCRHRWDENYRVWEVWICNSPDLTYGTSH
jgi:hypothetical protein